MFPEKRDSVILDLINNVLTPPSCIHKHFMVLHAGTACHHLLICCSSCPHVSLHLLCIL